MYATRIVKGFFDLEVKPLIERSMPGTMSRIACGFFVPESCYINLINEIEAKDTMPPFQILLFEQNDDLTSRINELLSIGLPDIFEGLRVAKIEGDESPKTIRVFQWQDFLDQFIGLRRRPTEPIGYAKVSEAQFHCLLAGQIFWDPEMELARAQGQWDHMPQEVWFWRLCWVWKNIIPNESMAQMVKDDGTGIARLSVYKRIEWACRLAFLSARKYAPPNHLLLKVLRNITDFGGIAERLSWCLNSADLSESINLCDEVLCDLRSRLVARKVLPIDLGLTDNDKVCDPARISDHFLSVVPSNFRNQASRICPIDLIGSLAQSSKFAP